MVIEDKEQLLEIYRLMLTIRLAELRLGRLFADGEVPGFIHLSVGQEAVSTAMGMLLRKDDTVASTHRGHGHALAKGIDLGAFFLELMAKEEGICKGRGGSMHVAQMSIGMLGANAIVGASVPIAVGSALAHQIQKTDAIAVAFFGDGAIAEGVLHESLNLAALWNLPILFVCENNGWAEFSPTHKQFVAPLSKLSDAFSIPYTKVNGNNVLEILKMGQPIIENVRQGNGPQVIECITHRWRGHYEGDPQKYRDSKEIEELKDHDPVAHLESVLSENAISVEQQQAVRTEIEQAIEIAVTNARQGSEPLWDKAVQDVYTTLEGY